MRIIAGTARGTVIDAPLGRDTRPTLDRVRENVKLVRNETFEEKVNLSINQTLMRSINTTITTLLTIGMIYILGVQSIREFAFPLIVGILAGLYSSVCLSGSLWTLFKKKNTRVK